MAEDADSGRRTKVERVVDDYGLEEWGPRLEAAWLGEGTERTSLRQLADAFNRAVLEAALDAAGESVTDPDVDHLYRVLTGDDVSRSDAVRKRRELERSGVDVEAVQSDFVTHQAIHTYLTSVREASLPKEDPADRLERKRATIERLAGRTRIVTDATLEELTGADRLTDRDYEVVVNVRTVCGNCGTDYAVAELLEQGGCDCRDDRDRRSNR